MRTSIVSMPLVLLLIGMVSGEKAEAAANVGTGGRSTVSAPQSPQSGEQIKWRVSSGGGNRGLSTSYILSGTVGQTAIGQSGSTSFSVNAGFWQVFESGGGGCCMARVGDANSSGDDMPTIGDVSVIIDAKFITGSCDGVLTCLGEADINVSGGASPLCDDITIGDISMLIDDLFITGEPPFVRNVCAQ